jgi:hypothetical protein
MAFAAAADSGLRRGRGARKTTVTVHAGGLQAAGSDAGVGVPVYREPGRTTAEAGREGQPNRGNDGGRNVKENQASALGAPLRSLWSLNDYR